MEKKNNNKKKIIFISKLNKYFIFPFLVPILNIYPSYIVKYIIKNYNLQNTDYFKSIYICSSCILGGLFYLITLFKTKKDDNETNKSKMEVESLPTSGSIHLIYNPSINIDHKKKYLFLLIMSILFSAEVFFNQVYASKKNVIDSKFYHILFISCLSNLILKVKIFTHQKFSIFLSFIGFIFVFISIIPKISQDDIAINIYLIFNCFCYSLFLVLVKFITFTFFLSPYLCCLWIGNFSTLLILIYFIIHTSYKNGDLSNLLNTFNFSNFDNKPKFYILLITSFIIYSLTQFFTYMTIYYFSPMIFLLTQIVFPLIIWIIDIIRDDYVLYEMIFTGIGYLILLFAVLIYHEIIILNFCGLSKNTRKFIEEREKKEIASIEGKEDDIFNTDESRERRSGSGSEDNYDNIEDN